MATNTLKLTKQHSQPSSSPISSLLPSGNSLLQLQHHISLDFSKDRESVLNSKDTQPQSSATQPGIKKLAFLLDPRKDTPNSISSSHTSPKSFLGTSKSSKIKISTSLENSNLNLISPKDLVRLAMSKHKPKANVKKVTVQNSASMPRNVRKSLGPGLNRTEKRDESRSKIASNSMLEDNSSLSKTPVPLYQDKSAKLKRMKLIYNDITQSEIARLTKSTVYTPQEASGRLWQGTLSPNRSNSGLLWTGSPNATISTASKGKSYLNQGMGSFEKGFFGKDSEEEKSYRKRASVEHVASFLKECKPSSKQSKRQEKKSLQPRKMTSLENPKTSVSFSRLMSNNTIDQETLERAKSPVGDPKGKKETEEGLEILEASGVAVNKDPKPRDGFIADLKSWVNEIVKPQPQEEIMKPKNPAAAEKVKEAQEGLLEKLRETLENDEFVRREDYERLYREKDCLEDELDAVKEENAQLRAMLWKIHEENEAREIREIEEKKMMKDNMLASSYEPGLTSQVQESMVRQNKELEVLRRRENVVKDVLKMIWKAGIEIGDLQQYDEMMNGNQEIEERQEEYEQSNDLYSAENSYYGNSAQQEQFYQNHGKQGYGHPEHYKMNEKYATNLNPIGENIYNEQAGYDNDSYMEGITEQKEDIEESHEASRPLALSEMADSEPATSNRQSFVALPNPTEALPNMVKKIPNVRSTADSSLLASAKPITPLSNLQSRTSGKLKIDLSGVGGNMKSNAFSSNSSAEKGLYIMTDGGQSLGFHEEFMSKLDEFSPSWRQDALNYQKFN